MVTPVDAITNAIDRYVIRPSNAFGLGGFVFDVEGDTTVNLKNDITDHFLEDNSTIQDHIAVKPKKVTLKSYVGELIYEPESSETINVERTVRKLTILNDYLPELTATAQAIKDISFNDITSVTDSFENITAQTVNKATNYYGFVQNLINADSKQQEVYMYLKSLAENKILVSLQTPFEYMTNMAIESITAFQSEGSKYISDFSVTLKEIRTVEILTEQSTGETQQGSSNKNQGRAASQSQTIESIGSVSGVDAVRNNDLYPDNDYLPPVVQENYSFDVDTSGLTQEDLRGLRLHEKTGYQPVADDFKAGKISNVSE